MAWLLVLTLIVLGLALIFTEVVVFPGTAVAGLLGAALAVVGVYLSYVYFGSGVGATVLSATVLSSAVAVYYSFSTRTWERFALRSKINGKLQEEIEFQVMAGNRGRALSDLRPVGKAEIQGEVWEVQSADGKYLSTGVQLEVTRVRGRKIFVKKVV